MLAWLRALADPTDSGAVVRALSPAADRAALRRRRPPHPARPPAQARHAVARSPRRWRARSSRRRGATARARSCASTGPPSTAFEDRRPDAFVHAPDRADRPAPPAGVRHAGRHRRAAAQHRQAVRAGHRVHAPRAAGHARATSRATSRRSPSPGCARRRPSARRRAPAVRVMTMHAAKGLEFDHVFVLGLSAARDARAPRAAPRRRARRAAQGARRAPSARPTRRRCAGCCTWR